MSPKQRTGVACPPRSPPPSTELSPSHDNPELHSHLVAATTATQDLNQNKDPDSPLQKALHDADKVLQQQQAPMSEPRSPGSVVSESSQRRRDLDLKSNDNTFHVLANLVVSHFTEPDAVTDLDTVLPRSRRLGFVDALRYRLKNSCPPESDAQIHVLTRRCQELGLDKQGAANPLFASSALGLPPKPVPNPSGAEKIHFSSAPTNTKPPSGATKPPQHITPRDDNSVTGSILTSISMVSESQVSTTENLARQQLMAELRDASKFMAESKTPDAAEFWREHVVKLQARLRALHGTEPAVSPTNPVAGTPKEILEANRRLLGEHQEQTAQMQQDRAFQSLDQSLSGEYVPPGQSSPTHPGLYQAPSRSMETVTMGATGVEETVDVVAPADLPAGYTFEAELDGKRFIATVPAGGVLQGDTFSSLMKDVVLPSEDMGGVPRGEWRDRLTDCGAFGLSHTHVLKGLFCPLVALGQVMTRTGLDFLGRPSRKGSKSAYITMLKVVIAWVSLNALVFAAYNLKWSQGMELTHADWVSLALINMAMLVFGIYVVSVTRASLRTKYHIPEKRCYDLEDFYCATFFMPCSVCQMDRHTVDYNEQDANWFTPTGLNGEKFNPKDAGIEIV